jgi:hypothetical protein
MQNGYNMLCKMRILVVFYSIWDCLSDRAPVNKNNYSFKLNCTAVTLS